MRPEERVEAVLNSWLFHLFLVESFSWSKTRPAAVSLGSPANLSWDFSLSPEERQRADVFSLIIWEQEKYLYSDEWMVLAIKQPVVSLNHIVKKNKAISVIEGKPASLALGQVTERDLTRFRCTFFSSFAAPKNIIQLSIAGKISDLLPYWVIYLRCLLLCYAVFALYAVLYCLVSRCVVPCWAVVALCCMVLLCWVVEMSWVYTVVQCRVR